MRLRGRIVATTAEGSLTVLTTRAKYRWACPHKHAQPLEERAGDFARTTTQVLISLWYFLRLFCNDMDSSS